MLQGQAVQSLIEVLETRIKSLQLLVQALKSGQEANVDLASELYTALEQQPTKSGKLSESMRKAWARRKEADKVAEAEQKEGDKE